MHPEAHTRPGADAEHGEPHASYPGEVVKPALELHATAVILPKRPSGDPTRSRDEVEMTAEIKRRQALCAGAAGPGRSSARTTEARMASRAHDFHSTASTRGASAWSRGTEQAAALTDTRPAFSADGIITLIWELRPCVPHPRLLPLYDRGEVTL